MAKQLRHLTAEQRAAIPAFVARYIGYGLLTGEADWDTFDTNMRACYRYAKLPDTFRLVRVQSPLVCVLAGPIAARLLSGAAVDGAVDGAVDAAVRVAVDDAVDGAVDGAVDAAVRVAVDDAVDDAVGVDVGVAVDDAVCDAVCDAVDGAVDDAVDDAVGAAVRDAVDGAVGAAVRDAVRDAVVTHVRSNWWRYLGGQAWISWNAYTAFFRDVCHVQLPGDLWDRDRAYEATKRAAWWSWPHTHFVMVCNRPVWIDRDTRGQLHSAARQAIQWPDGWGLWMWHGVRVTEQIVLRPETITASQFLTEKNQQVQAVMVERMGYERVCQLVGAKTIHKKTLTINGVKHPYEVLDFTAAEVRCRFLKMTNPSMGIYHLEPLRGMPNTVQEALHSRKPDWMQAIPVSPDGLDWYQQGDVLIVPDGATSLKPYPSLLT